jgi:hypothetical protein
VAACAGGGCAPCAADLDCPTSQRCVEGACQQPLAVCADRRCRVRCSDDSVCAPGEVCTALGHCLPAVCQAQLSPQVTCELTAEWRALERCLDIPCPTAEADGRIGRILPENLDDLPSDSNPDDIPN